MLNKFDSEKIMKPPILHLSINTQWYVYWYCCYYVKLLGTHIIYIVILVEIKSIG